MARVSEGGARPTARGRRRAARGTGPANPGPSVSRTPGATRVLHVLAHPGDALTATGSELFRSLREPGRPVAVVCLARSGPAERDRLLRVVGRGGAWQRTAEALPDGGELDVFALAEAPHVEVCFADPAEALAEGTAATELADRAAALLDLFEPGTVCTLDPDPEHTGWSEEGGAERPDHPEHRAVAQAVLEAVRQASEAGAHPVVVECFRGPGSCEAEPAPVPAVVRYPGRRVFLTRGTDGRLTAYAVLGGRIARWTERTPGGPEWGERELLDTPGLLPVLAVAQTQQGWVHLVSMRRTPRPGGGAKVEVMHAVQYQSGRPLGDWRSLGTPNGHADKGREIGVPAVVVDGEGCLHAFARNFGRGVNWLSQRPDGSWTSWEDINGSEVRDGLVAVLDDDGHPELFAPSADGVLRWRRDDEGRMREVHDDRMPLFPAPGTAITALLTGPGRVTVYGCDVRDRMLHAYRTDRATTPIGSTGGEGVTALRMPIEGYDCTVLLQRSAEGAVAVGAYPTEQEHGALWWERTGGTGVREPDAAIDAFGRLVIASLDGDGRLAVVRQDIAVSGLALGGWVTA